MSSSKNFVLTPVEMTVASSRDFLFCPLTGTLLELDAASGLAKCPVCNWTRSLAGVLLAVHPG